MHEVKGRSLTDRLADRALIQIKVRAQCAHESWDILLREQNDQVYILCGPRDTMQRASERTANDVANAERIKNARQLERDGQDIMHKQFGEVLKSADRRIPLERVAHHTRVETQSGEPKPKFRRRRVVLGSQAGGYQRIERTVDR